MPAIDTRHSKPTGGQHYGGVGRGADTVTVRTHTRRKPVRKPSTTNIARTQEQQYASQGAAVKKQAKRQVRRAKLTSPQPRPSGDQPQTRAKDIQRAESYTRAQYTKPVRLKDLRGRSLTVAPKPGLYKRGTTVPPDIAFAEQSKRKQAAHKADVAGKVAPVLKVLEQTTRPLHGVAAGTKAAIEHKPILEHVGAGLANKEKTTFSDVLKSAGVKNKTVRRVAGFGLDVAADPTTYLTLGAGSIGAKAGAKAAAKTEEAAQKAAAKATPKPAHVVQETPKEARRAASRAIGGGPETPTLAERAAKQAARKKAHKGSGLSVKFGGHEVPGIRRGTAAAARPVRRTARAATPERVRNRARGIATDLNPDITPVGAPKAESQASIQATRTARAKASHGMHRAQEMAIGIRSKIPEDDWRQVIDAIEARDPDLIPKHLLGGEKGKPSTVKLIRDRLIHARRQEKRAGEKGGTVGGRGPARLGPIMRTRIKTGTKVYKQTKGKGARKNPFKLEVGTYETRLGSKRGRATRTTIPGKVRGGAKGYFPHSLTPEGMAALEKTRGMGAGIGRKVVRPGFNKARKAKRKAPLAELRKTYPGQYREDLPGVFAERISSGERSVARADLNRQIADTGKTMKRGDTWDPAAHPGYSIYRVKGSDIQPLTNKAAQKALRPLHLRTVKLPDGSTKTIYVAGKAKKAPGVKGGKGGRLVMLNDEIVERSLTNYEAKLKTFKHGGIVHTLDRTQSGFKRLAIATPGFHVRNIVGDLQNAYLGQPGHRIPGNIVRGGRVLKAYGRQERALKHMTPAEVGKAMLKTGRYGKITYDEAAQKLRDAGAFRSGYIARELPELAASGGKALKTKRLRIKSSGPYQFARRSFLAREDLPRLTTAIEMLRNGATFEEAASQVAKLHFDYQHLTDFERQVMRRAMPFYTWNARNIPLQAKTVIQRPGKYAQFQKIREEATKQTNPGQTDEQTRHLYRQLEQAGVKLPKGWEKYLSNYEQRNAGIPISWKGHKFTVSVGLPLQDVGLLPGVAGRADYSDRALSLVTPILKDPVEWDRNYSFFFRDQIEKDHSPLVPAPAYVKTFPEALKKKLGVTDKFRDKKTGKVGWGWPGKVDYVAHAIPGIPNYAQQLATPGTDRRGRGVGGRALQFSGIRSIPIDPRTNAINLAYARQQEIRKRLDALGQQGIDHTNPNAEWRKLNDQLKITLQIAYQGKAARGDAVLPKQGGPRKVRRREGSLNDAGSLGGGSLGDAGSLD